MPNAVADRPIDAVVFDFDGVILESADIKTAAFRDLFSDRPSHVEAIVALHEAHAGVSRFKKFEMIYRDVLREPLAPGRAGDLGKQFEILVTDRIMKCEMVRGAKGLLERLCGNIPLFIVSGTPQDELRTIVKQRDLARFFEGIFGSPRTKFEIAAAEIKKHGFRQVIMVGDAMTDYDAAQASGFGFIGRVAEGHESPFPRGTVTIVDLSEFKGAARRLGKTVAGSLGAVP